MRLNRSRWSSVLAATLAVLTAGCACRASEATPERPAGPSGPPEAVAAPFLAAWERKDVVEAARLTTAPDRAGQALSALASGLPYTGLHLTPGAAEPPGSAVPDAPPGSGAGGSPPGSTGPGDVAVRVPFTVAMTFPAGPWTYASSLAVVAVGDRWAVQWSPTIIHPALSVNDTLVLAPVAGAAAGPPADRKGRPLTSAEHPSLARLLGNGAVSRGPGAAKGTDGAAVTIVRRSGAREPLQVLTPAGAATGRATTFDADVQAVAQRAVDAAGGTSAGVVVLEAGTGHILAMASRPPSGTNVATDRGSPPGSTMKVISASALLARDYRPDTVVPCPQRYGNLGNPHLPDSPQATLEWDLANSCNTAFAREGVAHLAGDEFVKAAGAFGVTSPWDIGLGDPTTYLVMPSAGGDQSELANQLIGQGRLLASPLAMASVAATVATGSFHQPVLVEDAPRVKAAGLNGRVAADLRQMMRAVVTRGTARSLRSVPGAVGAKTGTAEAPGGTAGWVIAHRGDIAVAALVTGIGGGDGDTTAGPVVATILKSL
jgi:hypothetical protein